MALLQIWRNIQGHLKPLGSVPFWFGYTRTCLPLVRNNSLCYQCLSITLGKGCNNCTVLYPAQSVFTPIMSLELCSNPEKQIRCPPVSILKRDVAEGKRALWLPSTWRGKDSRFISLLTMLSSPFSHNSASGHSAQIQHVTPGDLSPQALPGLPRKGWLRNFQNDKWLRSLKPINKSIRGMDHFGGVRHTRGMEGWFCTLGMFQCLAWVLGHGSVQTVIVHCTAYPLIFCALLCVKLMRSIRVGIT